jgi:hypothetical protein
MGMVEIAYGGLYGALSEVDTVNHLARIERVTSKRSVLLPPPSVFGQAPFRDRHGWGRPMTDAEVEQWRRLAYP